MEISIILNIIFGSIVAIGFILYQVWLGSKVVKLGNETKELLQILDNSLSSTMRRMDDETESLSKRIDRLDSRLDREKGLIQNSIADTEQNIFKELELIKHDFDGCISDIKNRLSNTNNKKESLIKG
jgi:hypothetical protein